MLFSPTMMTMLLSMMAFASASVETYDFTCHGSRVLTTYYTTSMSSSWLGGLQVDGDFECASLGFGIKAAPIVVIDDDSSSSSSSDDEPTPAPPLPIMESEKEMENMQKHWLAYGKKALSIELWLSPNTAMTRNESVAPIMTLGFPRNSTMELPMWSGCNGLDVQINQLNSTALELFFSDDGFDGTHGVCRSLPVPIPATPSSVTSSLTQLLIVLERNAFSLFVNGQTIYEKARIGLEGNLASWNDNYKMQLFSSPLLSTSFKGSIYQLSLSDQSFTPAEATGAYLAGVEYIRHAATAGPTAPKPKIGNYNNSVPPPSTVEGLPSLLATPNNTFHILQGTTEITSLRLDGLSSMASEKSDGWWTLMIEIISIPHTGIITTIDNQDIHAGDLLPVEEELQLEYTALGLAVESGFPLLSASLQYTLQSTEYFNIPRESATGKDLGIQPEVLQYRVVAVDDVNQEFLSISTTVSQPIHVLHVNQPSTLKTNVSSTLAWSDFEVVSIWGNRPAAYFEDPIILADPANRNVDRIRVDVAALHGSFRLSDEALRLADFESCRSRDFYWQCVGTGNDDKFLTFVAYPGDIEVILKDMMYTGYYKKADNITITVWDGEGGQCLSAAEHASTVVDPLEGIAFSTIYDGQCHSTTLTFQVEPIRGFLVDDVQRGIVFYTLILPFIIMGCTCVVGCTVCCTKQPWKSYKVGKNTEIYPEAEADTSEDQQEGNAQSTNVESNDDDEQWEDVDLADMV